MLSNKTESAECKFYINYNIYRDVTSNDVYICRVSYNNSDHLTEFNYGLTVMYHLQLLLIIIISMIKGIGESPLPSYS